jgi:hypothetical protein
VQASVDAVATRHVPTADAAATATLAYGLSGLAAGVGIIAARQRQLVASVASMPRTSPSASHHTSIPA